MKDVQRELLFALKLPGNQFEEGPKLKGAELGAHSTTRSDGG